jgi:hypothetical protein
MIREIKNYFCTNCGISLRGKRIPKKHQRHYEATHYGREIAIYDRKQDRSIRHRCPDCKFEWERI